MAYNGSVELISGITQKNNGNFPLVDASAVRVDDSTRLPAALEAKANAADMETALAGKVDKIPGKGLSKNDFSDADKAALDNIKTTDTTLTQSGKAADAKIVGNATEYYIQPITTGYYIATNGNSVNINSPVEANTYEYAVIACNPGDRFTVTGTGGGTPRLWCFIKSDGTPISRADASATENKLALEAPANAAYLVFNSSTTNANAEAAKGWNTQQVAADASELLATAGITSLAFTKEKYIPTPAVGQTLTLSMSNSTVCACAYKQCYRGQRFRLTGTSYANSGRGLYCFTDTDMKVLVRYYDSTATAYTDYEVIAPADGYFVTNMTYGEDYSQSAKTGFKDMAKTVAKNEADIADLRTAEGIADIAFTKEKYIQTLSVGQTMTLTMTTSTTAACAYKQCYRGQRFRVSGTSSTNSGRSPWAFTDSNLKVLERHTDTTATVYKNYEVVAPADGYFVVNMMYGTDYTYSAQTGFKDMAKTVAKNESDISDLAQYTQKPLTLLPSYILGSMAYKPLGAPDKGFFCLVTDDGREDGTLGVTSYTIPMAISKGIPVTFALMESSEVFTDDTWTATLVDAIENHGCSAAVHGVPRFTTYTEKGLADYIAGVVTFLSGKGIPTIEGAVCPAHVINKRVMAVAGGMMGVVRSGYLGGTSEDKASYNGVDLTNFCNYYTSGAGSNLYGLSSFNIASKALDYSKAAIDYAKANNKILIALYHEHSTDIPDAETKTKIEAVIDYALAQGLTFITLGDIARLPIANPSTY